MTQDSDPGKGDDRLSIIDAPCVCGHALHRHDMGHGCIECRCRGFVEQVVTPDAAKARGVLCEVVRGVSEERWCAGWHVGAVDALRREGGAWLLLAAAAEGWPQGLDGEDGWEPLSHDEWVAVKAWASGWLS